MNFERKTYPKPIQSDYYLEDCMARAKKHPGLYTVPSRNEIDNLKVGQLVKLIFIPRYNSLNKLEPELLWVQLADIQWEKFVGFLIDKPENIYGIKPGEYIWFERKHISRIFFESKLPEPPKGKVATRRLPKKLK